MPEPGSGSAPGPAAAPAGGVAAAGSAPRSAALIPLKGLRGAIARNMTQGWQAPRVAMAMDVDMSGSLALQARLEGAAEARAPAGADAVRQAAGSAAAATRIGVTALVLRAVALALRAHPRMNALMREGGIEPMPDIHVALAVALDEGLMAPVIRDADRKPLEALAVETRELAVQCRAGLLPPKAYQSGTFTLTNLGAAGVDWFTPVLNPPQVGILGLSRVAERAVVRDGRIVAAPMTTLTLVFDHRAVDGHPAAQFLATVRDLLEAGEGL